MRPLLSFGALVTVAALATTGCATKKWVNEVMSKQEVQFDTRVSAVDSRLGDETRRLDGRVGGLEGRVTETDAVAKSAKARADEAYTRADDVDGRLTRLWNNRHKRNVVDTLHVQFGFNRHDLSDGAQTALLQIIKELKENPALTVDLEGFTDQAGPREYNIQLSQRRVEAVRRYLIQNGAELPRVHSVGLGMVNGAGAKEEAAKQRRVTVRMMLPTD